MERREKKKMEQQIKNKLDSKLAGGILSGLGNKLKLGKIGAALKNPSPNLTKDIMSPKEESQEINLMHSQLGLQSPDISFHGVDNATKDTRDKTNLLQVQDFRFDGKKIFETKPISPEAPLSPMSIEEQP